MPQDTPLTNTLDTTQDNTTPTTSTESTTPSVETKPVIPLEKHDDQVAKARQQEKDKLYPKLQEAKATVEAEKAARLKAEKSAQRLTDKLAEIEESTLTADQKLENRLKAIEARANDAVIVSEQKAQIAEQKVRDLELRLYREQKVREHGVTLTELVRGSSVDEIDASIQQAASREKLYREQIEAKVRDELAATKAASVPTMPVASSDEASKTASIVSQQDRRDLVKLRGKDYQEARKAMLERAKQSLRK
jgi:hypothetical protein